MWHRPFLWPLLQRDRENREHLKYFTNVLFFVFFVLFFFFVCFFVVFFLLFFFLLFFLFLFLFCFCFFFSKIRTRELATKPQTVINVLACRLVFSRLIVFFSRKIITFQKYFWCSWFSRFDCKLAWDQAPHCGENGKKSALAKKKNRARLASLADIFPIWPRFLPFSPVWSLVPG